MPDMSPEDRADQLTASPAGCVLLLYAEEHNLTPDDLANPHIGLTAISLAIGEITPWKEEHDWIVATALEHGPRLRSLALRIVSHPGIAWWWAPIDRENQLWLPHDDMYIWPEEDWELRPAAPPTRWETYAHAPRLRVTTSERRDGLSSELAHVLSGAGDWALDFPIHARHVSIRADARVLEITTAQDWHDLVRRYPARGEHGTMPDFPNAPWGTGEGLMVPDWSEVARDWDGVHVTPWALLTATQVRVTSDIGWTEPWAWEGAHTLWLDWVFDQVQDLPPLDEGTIEVPYYSSQVLTADQATFMLRVNPPQRYTDAWPGEPGMTCQVFGDVEEGTVYRYTLTSSEGISASILTYGGIIQSLVVPDASGKRDNVVLGFDNVNDYVRKSPYFGAIIGRYANRIANGRFSLHGEQYQLPINNGPNSLHGGANGFDRRLWTASIESEGDDSPRLRLSRTSPNGEEGYPGAVDVSILYQVWGTALHVMYNAVAHAPTVVNLTNHSYFNLAGEGNGTILDHRLQLLSTRYLPVDDTLIPTGEMATVAGTPFDFTEPQRIGDRIDQPGNEQLAFAGGYDHTFVVTRPEHLHGNHNLPVAVVVDPESGRVMAVSTDQPGVQFYSGNFLDGSFAGTGGRVYERRAGFCLETQHFPDSPNQPHFPSTVLLPGEPGFHSSTTFAFGIL